MDDYREALRMWVSSSPPAFFGYLLGLHTINYFIFIFAHVLIEYSE